MCSAKWTAASVAPQRGQGSPSRRWTWSGIGSLSGTVLADHLLVVVDRVAEHVERGVQALDLLGARAPSPA